VVDFARQLWRKFQDDDVLNAAATLAFFFLLAIFPAAIFVLSLLPSISIPHLQQSILDLVHQVLPEQSAKLLEENVQQLSSERTHGLLTFGLIFTIWSASAGVYATIEQLNRVYGVKDRRGFWKAHGIAILLMMVCVLLAIASLSLAIVGGVVQSWLASIVGRIPALLIFFATLRWFILAVALLVALAVIYRFGPDANVGFRLISPGNLVAATLIVLASVVFRVYVSRFGNYGATYGNLAAVVVLILWMYLFGIALLVGGEINAILRPDKPRRSGPNDPER
jgi:membrane protein